MPSPEADQLKQRLTRFAADLRGAGPTPPSLAEMRAVFATFCATVTPPAEVTWTEADADGVPALWANPAGGATDRVIQYLHGGAYLLGDTDAYRHFTGHVARAAGCRVLSVNYRRAPEHPHPAPLEDSLTAYRWLLAQGTDPARMALAGDSAGGGLTFATLLALRDAGLPLPAAAVALSPWTDLEGTGASMTSNAPNDVLVQKPLIQGMATLFLQGQDARAPLAAPLHGDYAGLPPLYLQVGGHETLLDDARRVAATSRSAGVAVVLDVAPEMQHVFQMGAGWVPESDAALARVGAFLRARLGLGDEP